MKQYTIAELRQKTRQIFNEAELEPIEITRYGEAFILSKTLAPAAKPKPQVSIKPNPAPKNEGQVKSQTAPTPTVSKVITNANEALAAIKTLPKQEETMYCKNGHIADYRGVCMWKGCKYA